MSTGNSASRNRFEELASLRGIVTTRVALANLKSAEDRVSAAIKELHGFHERTGRQFSKDERAEGMRLLENLIRSTDEYWEAFERAATSQVSRMPVSGGEAVKVTQRSAKGC